MKSQLDEMEKEAMTLIAKYARDSDVGAISRLSDTARRISNVKQQLADIDSEYRNISESLNRFRTSSSEQRGAHSSESVSESRRKKLKIEIDWSRIGRGTEKEVISENVSSATVVKFTERLVRVFGERCLEQLVHLRLNRGPFVSKNPDQDFCNKAAGSLYQHQRVPGTDYYVLTHSANAEKVADVRRAAVFLELPIGGITVTEVPK